VKLRDSIRIRIGRPDSIIFESDGPIRKFWIAAPASFAIGYGQSSRSVFIRNSKGC